MTAVPQALAAAPKLKALQLEGNPFDDKKLPKVCTESGRDEARALHLVWESESVSEQRTQLRCTQLVSVRLA